MRIAIVTTSWPETEGDPAGHFVAAGARALEREGWEVEVVRPPTGGAFGWPGVTARLRERPWAALEAASWVLRARARVRRLEVDAVVAHWAVPCAWPVGVVARGRLEVVSHGGDVRLLAGLPRLLRERLVRTIARRAHRWTFVSETLRDALLGSLGAETRADVERIARVEAAPIDLPDVRERAEGLRRALGGDRVAVSAGRLIASKRVDRAIEHVARARDFDLLVVIGDGPEREPLQALARARGVAARFVGRLPREETLAWIAASDALIHASEAEGLSTVVREAEAFGTPVVRLGGAS
jgi:glycosyltransferase involved in cell wall biosynthesis